MKLTNCQQQATDKFADFLFDDKQREFLLTGPAGTGKSFLLQRFITEARRLAKFNEVLEDGSFTHVTTMVTATTNKAVEVLAKQMPDANIVGALPTFLGIRPVWDRKLHKNVLGWRSNGNKQFAPTLTVHEQHLHIIIIDEVSMMSEDLYTWFQRFLKSSAARIKVVYVGDKLQLPPVDDGNNLAPPFEADIPCAELKEVVRQDNLTSMFRIVQGFRTASEQPTRRLGKWPELDSTVEVFNPAKPEDMKKWTATILAAFEDRHNYTNRILAYTNARVNEYISMLRKEWKLPDDPQPGEIVVVSEPIISDTNRLCAYGDSFIEICNSYRAYPFNYAKGTVYRAKSLDHKLESRGTFSFFVPDDPKVKKKALVHFSKKKEYSLVKEINNAWSSVRFPQATTVHKSQGSTFDKVFVDITNINKCRDQETLRKLLYTSVSRASQKLYILGNPR
jgi:exodeoxyribonuclease-5